MTTVRTGKKRMRMKIRAFDHWNHMVQESWHRTAASVQRKLAVVFDSGAIAWVEVLRPGKPTQTIRPTMEATTR